jgi:hypothetical protein
VRGVLDEVLGVFRRTDLKRRLPELRLLILRLMRNGWHSMILGMVAHLALQFARRWPSKDC